MKEEVEALGHLGGRRASAGLTPASFHRLLTAWDQLHGPNPYVPPADCRINFSTPTPPATLYLRVFKKGLRIPALPIFSSLVSSVLENSFTTEKVRKLDHSPGQEHLTSPGFFVLGLLHIWQFTTSLHCPSKIPLEAPSTLISIAAGLIQASIISPLTYSHKMQLVNLSTILPPSGEISKT